MLVSKLLALAFAAVASRALPTSTSHLRGGTLISEGYHEGFYYNYWTDYGANATYTNGPGGSFSIEWTTGGNLIGGKGWKSESFDRILEYSADVDFKGNSYLAVNGWTNSRGPLLQYYILENHGTYNPSSTFQPLGTLDVDGSTYDIGYTMATYWTPTPHGTVIYTFWSVRRDKRNKGRINVGAHVKAWRAYGQRFVGENEFTIMACEGYQSTGTCAVTLSVIDPSPD